MIKHFVFVVLAFALTGPLQASERQDIAPGQENWHRYRFFVITLGEVAVRQQITVSWDNLGTGILVALFDTDDPNAPRTVAFSTGNDRFVSLDIGLLDGTYQLVVAAVVAPTHYHLNVTYGRDELLFRQPNGPLGVRSELFMDRLIGEQLAPHVAKLTKAVSQ